jgi:hypothetical protein
MQNIRGLAKVTATVSLACGIAAAAAGPALAASPNEAYAANATGLIATNAPLDEATYPGTSPVTAASATVAGLVTAGALTDTATATGASSTIANVGVATTLLNILSATSVSSQCTFDPTSGTVSGTSTILGLALGSGAAQDYTNLTTAQNLTLTNGLTTVANITLNRQTTAADGTLTVDAVYVSLVGSTQTLTLGTSVCNQASLAGAPALPGMATPIGATLAGLVGFGGIGYFLNRRRRIATQD